MNKFHIFTIIAKTKSTRVEWRVVRARTSEIKKNLCYKDKFQQDNEWFRFEVMGD